MMDIFEHRHKVARLCLTSSENVSVLQRAPAIEEILKDQMDSNDLSCISQAVSSTSPRWHDEPINREIMV